MENGQSQRSSLQRLLSSYGAIAAALAAALYLAGITTLTVRMHLSGLGGEDILPLFSLDQLLRIGLTWIYPAGPAILVLAAMYVASIAFERKLDQMATSFEKERVRQLDSEKREEWTEAFGKARVATAWMEVEGHVKTAIAEADPEHPSLSAWKSLRRRLLLFSGWTALVLLTLIGFCIPFAALIGIATLGVLLVVGSTLGSRPARQALIPLYLIVLCGILANAILNPRPLPQATIAVRDSSKIWSGELVVIADGTWFLADRNAGVIAVPGNTIQASHLFPQPRKETLGGAIQDFFQAK